MTTPPKEEPAKQKKPSEMTDTQLALHRITLTNLMNLYYDSYTRIRSELDVVQREVWSRSYFIPTASHPKPWRPGDKH